MKKYSNRSRIKKVKVIRSAKSEFFFAEIINNPAKNISIANIEKALKEISKLVESAWGAFPRKYLQNSVIHASHLLVLRNNSDEVVGIAPIKELFIDGRNVYSFGLTAVHPDYQGLGLMKKMHAILGRRIFIESLLHLRTHLEFVFITPNIRTIGAIAKVADFIYPNPYLISEESGEVEEADDCTWTTVNHYLVETGENFRKLNRNGCVIVGFYDDKPNLIVRERTDIPDKKLSLFAKKYLKPGNEVVVRAVVGIGGVIRGNF